RAAQLSSTGSAHEQIAFRSQPPSQLQRRPPSAGHCHYPHSAKPPTASFNPASMRPHSSSCSRPLLCLPTSQNPQDSKIYLPGFHRFKLQFHSCFAETFSTAKLDKATEAPTPLHFRFAPESDRRPPTCNSVVQCQ